MSEKSKTKTLVNFNESAFNQAMAIIEDDTINNNSLKSMLIALVQDILQLSEVASETVKLRNNEDSSSSSSVKVKPIIYGGEGGRVQAIERTQDIISSKHTNILNKSVSESEYKGVLRDIVTSEGIKLPGTESVNQIIDELYKELKGFSVVDEFLNQPEDVPFEEFVEEIRIDDFNDIRIVKNGIEERTDASFESPKHLEMFANTLVNNAGLQLSLKKPAVKLRIGETTRVTMIRDPIATRDRRLTLDPSVTHVVIRKQRSTPFTVERLVNIGSIDRFGSELLKCLVGSGICTTFIGGTGTGKTSMMVPFLKEIDQRTISMAEIDEMNFRSIDFNKYITDKNGQRTINPNYLKATNSAIMWETPDLGTEIINGLVGFEGMFNIALTMTPSVIIIQETKGAEAASLENAAISGHQTVTSTHCENPQLFPTRMMKMIQMSGTNVSEDILMKEIAEAFPLIVTCIRLKDGTRKISEITEMLDYIPETKEVRTNTLIRYEISHNAIDPQTNKLKTYGSHKIYNLPSEKMKQKMLKNGLLKSTWDKLTTDFEAIKTSEKPADLDRTIYKERG